MLPNVKEAIARLEAGIAGKESYEMTEVSVANLRVVLGTLKADEDAEFLKMLQEAVESGTGIMKDGRHVPYADFVADVAAAPAAGAVPAMTDEQIVKTWNGLDGIAIHNQAARFGVDTQFALRIAFARTLLAAMPQQAAPAIPEGWQPIETVPEDGYFLVHEDTAIRALLRINGEWQSTSYPVIVSNCWGDVIVGADAQRLLPEGYKLGIEDGCCKNPTHWHPLPPPPAQEGETK
jgi:hypothetical protein